MESQDQLSTDPSAIAETVQSCAVVTSMTISDSDDGNDVATTSPVFTSVNTVTTPHPSVSKKVVEKELRQPFPVKVYEMLENADEKQFSHVVSWNATGTGFMVHDKEHFTREIVPDYFNLTKYKSFQRQVGFVRSTRMRHNSLPRHFYIPLAFTHYIQTRFTCTLPDEIAVVIWISTSDRWPEQGIAISREITERGSGACSPNEADRLQTTKPRKASRATREKKAAATTS